MNELVENLKSERGLTPKQEAFLNAFFGEAGYNIEAAKEIAGYSKNSKSYDVIKPLLPHIEEAINAELAVGAVRGVQTLLGVLNDPTKPGNKEAMAAANSLLDRFGITKEKAAQVNVNVDVAPVVYLPQKAEIELNKEDFLDITPENE